METLISNFNTPLSSSVYHDNVKEPLIGAARPEVAVLLQRGL